jgi:hypothetical protein
MRMTKRTGGPNALRHWDIHPGEGVGSYGATWLEGVRIFPQTLERASKRVNQTRAEIGVHAEEDLPMGHSTSKDIVADDKPIAFNTTGSIYRHQTSESARRRSCHCADSVIDDR